MDHHRFDFRWHVALVDNRNSGNHMFRRMSGSLDIELGIPLTDRHLLMSVTTSLFQVLGSPDAWEIIIEDWGLPSLDVVFPEDEWVRCPECDEQVINTEMEEHIDTHHNGEHRRFPPYGKTKTELEGL